MKSAAPSLCISRFRTAALMGLTLLCGLGATDCDRSLLTASHARAYHEAFARQIANPGAGSKPNADRMVQGLDSQEAAIVSKTYRRNLAPKDEDATRGQMLYSTPQAGRSDRADLPPPSVPGEQR